jgi:hypothetical protein
MALGAVEFDEAHQQGVTRFLSAYCFAPTRATFPHSDIGTGYCKRRNSSSARAARQTAQISTMT